MARLFVAAYPPPDVVEALWEQLPRPADPGLRWVPREQLHVTLRFIGEADEGDAAAALRALSAPSTTVGLGPAVSRLGGEVLCLPATGLDGLAAAVATTTRFIGEASSRPFSGHLTIGRFRHRQSCDLTGTPFRATFDLREVALVRSTISSSGAHHEVIATFALAPRGA